MNSTPALGDADEPANSEESRKAVRRFGLGCVGVGLLMALIPGWSAWRLRSSQSWSETEGELLAVGVGSSASASGRDARWFVTAECRYRVDGRELTTSDLRLGVDGGFADRSGAEAWVVEHPRGSVVPVFFDPQDPTDAVLERAADARSFTLLPMAALSLLVGFGILRKGRARG